MAENQAAAAPSNEPCLKVAQAYVKDAKLDDALREVDFVCSTDDLDSDDEVVEQKWDLTRFGKNPVALYSHNRYGNSLPIGYWKNARVEGGALVATLKVATAAANPLAENVWQSLKEKTLRAVSVGFRPRDIRAEKRNDRTIYVLSDNLLYEISVVPIPANENALRLAKAKALESAEKVARMLDSEDKSLPPAPAGGAEDKSVNEKEFQDKISKLEGDLATEKTKTTTLTERVGVLDTELAAERKAHNELKLAGVGLELDKRVGKKIAPAEKPGLLKLAGIDRGLFDEQLKAIDARPDMGLTGEQISAKDPTPPTLPAPIVDDGKAFEAMVPRG